jgi:NADH:ubiquinone oxidoreductase subunit E
LPLTWLAGEIVTAGSYREEFRRMNTLKKIRKLLKPLWILQKPKKWLKNHRLFYLFKKYQISIVFGIK